MDALATLIERAAVALRAAGIEQPRREARLLAALALGCRAEAMLVEPDRPVGAREAGTLRSFVERRAAREPLSRIRGRREFWSLEFAIDPSTLDPRPDSETLVAAALDRMPADRAVRVIDFGTGSGCLLAAVLSERPLVTGIGIDIDPRAVAIARANAADCGLARRARFVVADWRDPASLPAGPFELALANPPYIPSRAIAGLAPEVARYDPRRALDGGSDGLEAYRSLVPAMAALLAPEGHGIVELGEGQGSDVARLFEAAGFVATDRRRDLNGIERCLVVRAGSKKPFGDRPPHD